MNEAVFGHPWNERFVLRERLGAGGMGVVYAAHDTERDETVALKTLHKRDAAALYAFKKEFRALADVAHPNLVSLYELIADDKTWFFTMELVDGETFVDYVRPPGEEPSRPRRGPDSVLTATLPLEPSFAAPVPSPGGPQPWIDGRGTFDEERLRAAMRQLAIGVRAIHAAGKVHRDLKPHNVLVTHAGRLVILDFGIAKELAPTLSQLTTEAAFPGTLGYMSPEQARGDDSTPASDWYAVGVMLFEALTGGLPFTGSLPSILSAKLNRSAPSPASLVDGLPDDLVELCVDLLARDAADRPSPAAVLGRLGAVDASRPSQSLLDLGRRADAPLVGRGAHLETLDAAFRRTLGGQAVSVHVHGTSGMGKTAVIHAFLNRLIEESRAVVLPGRCYVNELVPYKALDGVVDSLSRYLIKLPRHEVEMLLPGDVRAVARVFGVLSRVEAIAVAAVDGGDGDQLTLRRRAFSALRELLGRIAEQQPLVLYIDDLQWADADSAALLADLLRPPDPPPILLLTSFRSEEIASQGFLADLLSMAEPGAAGAPAAETVAVEPLADAEATELARALLGGHPRLEPRVPAIVREARGSPFLIEQLAGYALASSAALDPGGRGGHITLAEMLEARIGHLPPGAEPLLLILAAAGRPLAAAVAHEAAGLGGDERPLIAALQAAQMVRASGSAETVELYHDRIRESLADRVDAGRARRLHRRLADTLVAHGIDDPEALFIHYRSAGFPERAAAEAVKAAEKASAALAFDRAALFYYRALDLGGFADGVAFELRRALAESLANAGRSGDAAAAFEGLADDASGVLALELRGRAAQEYIAGGYFDEGFAELRKVLEAVGLAMPSSFRRAILSLLWQRLRLRLRGFGFRPRRAAEVPLEELLRVDACFTAAAGLVTADTVLGADFQTRHLRFALAAGEPRRIARALGLEVTYLATAGTRVHARARRILGRATRLAREVDDPAITGHCRLHAGVLAYCVGDWRRSIERCDAAARIFSESCTGAIWEATFARRYGLSARLHRGEMATIRRRLPVLLAEADERGNVLAGAHLRTRFGTVWLAADDPEGCRRESRRALDAWSRQGFQLVHYNGLLSACQAALYDGDAAGAFRHLVETWPRVQRSFVPRIQIARIEGLFLRGRCALAAAAAGDDHGPLEQARRAAARLAREETPYSRPMADQIGAGCAHLAGDGARALELLGRAAEGFLAADMHLAAAGARWRRGELSGGEAGDAERAAAEAWMRAEKIRRPGRMAAVLAPGFARPGRS